MKARRTVIAFAVLLVPIVIVFATQSFISSGKFRYTSYERLRGSIQSIGPDKLQDWAAGLLKKIRNTRSNDVQLSDSQIAAQPDFIRQLRPQHIFISSGYVILDWGSGYGHWGVMTGPKGFQHWTGTKKRDDWYIRIQNWWPGIYGYENR